MVQTNLRTRFERRVRRFTRKGYFAPYTLTFEAHSQDRSIDYGTQTQWEILKEGQFDPEQECPITCAPLGADGSAVVRLPCSERCVFPQAVVEQAFRLSGPRPNPDP